MAEEKENQDPALRLKLGQSSVGGLNVFSGRIFEEKEYALEMALTPFVRTTRC